MRGGEQENRKAADRAAHAAVRVERLPIVPRKGNAQAEQQRLPENGRLRRLTCDMAPHIREMLMENQRDDCPLPRTATKPAKHSSNTSLHTHRPQFTAGAGRAPR